MTTPVEEKILRGEQITWIEGLFDCCIHGELTEQQARKWLEGEDLEIALRIIAAPDTWLERDPRIKAEQDAIEEEDRAAGRT